MQLKFYIVCIGYERSALIIVYVIVDWPGLDFTIMVRYISTPQHPFEPHWDTLVSTRLFPMHDILTGDIFP